MHDYALQHTRAFVKFDPGFFSYYPKYTGRVMVVPGGEGLSFKVHFADFPDREIDL